MRRVYIICFIFLIDNMSNKLITLISNELKKESVKDQIYTDILNPIMEQITAKYYYHYIFILILQLTIIILLVVVIYGYLCKDKNSDLLL